MELSFQNGVSGDINSMKSQIEIGMHTKKVLISNYNGSGVVLPHRKLSISVFMKIIYLEEKFEGGK